MINTNPLNKTNSLLVIERNFCKRYPLATKRVITSNMKENPLIIDRFYYFFYELYGFPFHGKTSNSVAQNLWWYFPQNCWMFSVHGEAVDMWFSGFEAHDNYLKGSFFDFFCIFFYFFKGLKRLRLIYPPPTLCSLIQR